MSHHKNAEKNHKLMTANISFKEVVTFQYMGMTTINQNCIHKDTKSRLNLENARCYSVQNLFVFPSPLLELKD